MRSTSPSEFSDQGLSDTEGMLSPIAKDISYQNTFPRVISQPIWIETSIACDSPRVLPQFCHNFIHVIFCLFRFFILCSLVTNLIWLSAIYFIRYIFKQIISSVYSNQNVVGISLCLVVFCSVKCCIYLDFVDAFTTPFFHSTFSISLVLFWWVEGEKMSVVGREKL